MCRHPVVACRHPIVLQPEYLLFLRAEIRTLLVERVVVKTHVQKRPGLLVERVVVKTHVQKRPGLWGFLPSERRSAHFQPNWSQLIHFRIFIFWFDRSNNSSNTCKYPHYVLVSIIMKEQLLHEQPPNVMTSLCFETLESNTGTKSLTKDDQKDQKDQADQNRDITSLSKWFATGVWLPFLVSLVLFLVCVQILPRVNPVPHLGFLAQYNPGLRQDVMVSKSSSSIDFHLMCLAYAGVWCLVSGVQELVLTQKSNQRSNACFRLLTLSLAFAETMFLTNATTDFIKFRIGALRPDFLHRCFGNMSSNFDDLPSSLPEGLESCPMMSTQKEEILEGLLSFPSGHTSMAMSCALFLSYYLFWCIFVLNPSKSKSNSQTPKRSRLIQQGLFILALVPTMSGLCVAMSRLTDFRHHFVDVLMGMFLGLVFSTLVFLRTIKCLDY